MSTPSGTLTLIDDLVAELTQDEPTNKRKANTVTTTVGGLVTIAITAITYWLEVDANAPVWLPMLALILGVSATTFGVSLTKNGMTDSVAERLHSELARRIDVAHMDTAEHTIVEEDPEKQQISSDLDAADLRFEAEHLFEQ